jgi:TonB family protein
MRRTWNEGQIPGGAESLEDQIYRPQILERHSKARKANPFITIPLTLLGYGALGLFGWWLVQRTRSTASTSQESVVVDLQDQTMPEAPQPTTPTPPPAAGGPPPGAIEKVDAPPPPPSVTQEAVPDKPPAELPTQDLSNAAVPAQPAGGANGTGAGSGPGAGGTTEGTGTIPGAGSAPTVVYLEYSDAEVVSKPVVPSSDYPKLARATRTQGTVKVEILIGLDGVPISAHATEGPKMLQADAEQIALRYRFKPEVMNGVPVMSKRIVPIKFQLN